MGLESWISLVGGIIGAVGGTVGIVTAIRSSRRDAWKEIEEENHLSFLAGFMRTQRKVGPKMGKITIDFEPGSTEWKSAEKLVERGILERGPKGHGYCIRGFYDKSQ